VQSNPTASNDPGSGAAANTAGLSPVILGAIGGGAALVIAIIVLLVVCRRKRESSVGLVDDDIMPTETITGLSELTDTQLGGDYLNPITLAGMAEPDDDMDED
jgi:hypothetical protein